MEEIPFEDRHVPRAEIDWERSAWWWYPLTRAVHPALKMTALVTSLIAIWIAQGGLWLADWLFDPAWNLSEQFATSNTTPFQSRLAIWISEAALALLSFERFGLRELAFVTFVALFWTAVLAMFGGVIARRGMVELGQRTVATWDESLRIVIGRWHSFLWSTGMHLVALAIMLLPVLLLGWLSSLSAWTATIAGILLIAAFPLVFAVGRFAVSLFVSFPLSVCAIAAEKRADAFEGFSRSNAYFFQRPVVTIVCAILLALVGLIGEQLISWTLGLGWSLIRGTYFFAGGATQAASEPYINTGNWLVSQLVMAFWFSYFWTATAATYLILRRCVDHTELDELDGIVSSLEQSLPDIPPPPSEATAEPAGDSEGGTSETPSSEPKPDPDQ